MLFLGLNQLWKVDGVAKSWTHWNSWKNNIPWWSWLTLSEDLPPKKKTTWNLKMRFLKSETPPPGVLLLVFGGCIHLELLKDFLTTWSVYSSSLDFLSYPAQKSGFFRRPIINHTVYWMKDQGGTQPTSGERRLIRIPKMDTWFYRARNNLNSSLNATNWEQQIINMKWDTCVF